MYVYVSVRYDFKPTDGTGTFNYVIQVGIS
jgi:hypothetical protein